MVIRPLAVGELETLLLGSQAVWPIRMSPIPQWPMPSDERDGGSSAGGKSTLLVSLQGWLHARHLKPSRLCRLTGDEPEGPWCHSGEEWPLAFPCRDAILVVSFGSRPGGIMAWGSTPRSSRFNRGRCHCLCWVSGRGNVRSRKRLTKAGRRR